jgi:hypothetical protein
MTMKRAAAIVLTAILLLSARGAIAQIPPPPITMTQYPNPSISLVLPAPGEARVSPVNPGVSPGNNLAGTNQVVNPPQSVFHHHPRRHH